MQEEQLGLDSIGEIIDKFKEVYYLEVLTQFNHEECIYAN